MNESKKPLNVFELESHGIPFKEWSNHKDKLPQKIWGMLEEEIKNPSGPIMLAYKEGVGYYILASGQGPGVVWMENPQRVSGPYPYEGNKE